MTGVLFVINFSPLRKFQFNFEWLVKPTTSSELIIFHQQR